MKLTVLMDNNTLIGKEYLGEPALSLYIEEGGQRILFDLGCTEAYVSNANKMGIDLKKANRIVFSHGHYDHTWGLQAFLSNARPAGNNSAEKPITLLAHPMVFSPKMGDGGPVGFVYSRDALERCFDLHATEKPYWITEKLCFLGEIPRTNSFENQRPLGKLITEEGEQDDFLFDDSALVYIAEEGLIIITGCSHSGICNIIEYAKKVCKEERILDVIGGFHLLDPAPEQIEGTLEYMKALKPVKLHPCHCTDLQSKIALAGVVRVEETGVGTVIEYK